MWKYCSLEDFAPPKWHIQALEQAVQARQSSKKTYNKQSQSEVSSSAPEACSRLCCTLSSGQFRTLLIYFRNFFIPYRYNRGTEKSKTGFPTLGFRCVYAYWFVGHTSLVSLSLYCIESIMKTLLQQETAMVLRKIGHFYTFIGLARRIHKVIRFSFFHFKLAPRFPLSTVFLCGCLLKNLLRHTFCVCPFIDNFTNL